MSTKNYIKLFRKGERKAFKEVFNSFYPALVLFAERIVHNGLIAEDIVQESFLKLWDKRKELYSEYGIKSYLYTTVKNRSINHLRKVKVQDRYVSEKKYLNEDNFDFESAYLEEESIRLFYAVIESLSVTQSSIIFKTLEGYSREEIAESLNLSVDTVKYHKTKAFNIIRKRLGDKFILFYIMIVLSQAS